MQTTVGALRNITTGILHTTMDDVYTFFEKYIGDEGIMTHHLPSAMRAILPILKKKVSSEWFEKEWLKEGLDGVITLSDISGEEKEAFYESFGVEICKMWDTIGSKNSTATSNV